MVRAATMGTLVYLADPANIKTVFAGSPTVYHAGEANSMLSGATRRQLRAGDRRRETAADQRTISPPPGKVLWWCRGHLIVR